MTGTECHVVQGLIAIRFDGEDRANVVEGVGALIEGEEITTAEQINGLFATLLQSQDENENEAETETENETEPLDEDLLATYLKRMILWMVDRGSEHERAQHLREESFAASPIHAMGRLNHLTKMPGTPPQSAQVPQHPPVLPEPSPGKIVAVVDSGVTEETPEWLKSGVKVGGPEDIERLTGATKPDASHGVFVASLIRRIAPEHTIHMARTASRPIGIFTGNAGPKHHLGANPTTELDVALAITRLVVRLKRSTCNVEALNLSLGGSACSDDDPTMAVIEEAIDYWMMKFPDSVVFAAGGNRYDTRPILPAALPVVRAVGAAADGGRVVVWNETYKPLDPPGRFWITDIAPGSELISCGGSTADPWVEWSGSSFATAVATACHVSRRPHQVVSGLVHWPDATLSYAGIPGLVVN